MEDCAVAFGGMGMTVVQIALLSHHHHDASKYSHWAALQGCQGHGASALLTAAEPPSPGQLKEYRAAKALLLCILQGRIGCCGMPQIGGPFAAAFIATSKDEFRKPERGMWDFFTAECNGSVQVGA